MHLAGTASRRKFARFAWIVLAYNLAVILWGAYVRASFSGDGCGARWPTCSGQFLPTEMGTPKLIEFTHRMMTSLDSLATISLVVWAFLAFPKKHAVRRYSVLAMIFLLIEALLGAGLVLFRYVAHDVSAGRAWYLSLHLTNTMLMMGAYTITAWLASHEQNAIKLWNVSAKLRIAVLITFAVSITGAIAALGDTLFPATSLANGMAQDFTSGSSLLLRLRLLHPAVAILSAVYLLWAAFGAMQGRAEESPSAQGGRACCGHSYSASLGRFCQHLPVGADLDATASSADRRRRLDCLGSVAVRRGRRRRSVANQHTHGGAIGQPFSNEQIQRLTWVRQAVFEGFRSRLNQFESLRHS